MALVRPGVVGECGRCGEGVAGGGFGLDIVRLKVMSNAEIGTVGLT